MFEDGQLTMDYDLDGERCSFSSGIRDGPAGRAQSGPRRPMEGLPAIEDSSLKGCLLLRDRLEAQARSGSRYVPGPEDSAKEQKAAVKPETVEAALQVASSTLSQLQREDIKLGAYANAFPPQTKEATANDGLDELREDLNPQEYLVWAQKWQLAGASVIGGCCGIGPEHIHALSRQFNI